MNPVNTLLRRNIAPGQIIGYALANLVGLAIILTAVQFFRDARAAISPDPGTDDAVIGRDFLILSRRVDDSALLTGAPTFSEDDIADIAARPWVSRVAPFTASEFNVSASAGVGGHAMSTHLFFESIPDEYFDVTPAGWTDYRPGPDTTVPVILSKDYLALYNFGFAASRGLPQLSESMIGLVPVTLTLSGPEGTERMPARIVGFSSRLNTIAVPSSFMEWANRRFAPGSHSEPSRLIVEVNSPGDPAIESYLAEHNLETAGDKADSGRLAAFLTVTTGVVIAIGAIISLLAVVILLLSLYLLLQKSREKLRGLMMLGYSPADVAALYCRMVIGVNAAVMLLAIAATIAARSAWQPPLASLGLHGASSWPTAAIGITLIAVITAGNVAAIRRTIRRYYRS